MVVGRGSRGGTSHLNARVSWYAMMQRCYTPSHLTYPNYGGAGVEVCLRWHDYQNFLADMGDRPDGFELDRIDNTKGYSPDNCRWVSREENHRNKRNNVWVTAWGETKTIPEWLEDERCSVKTKEALYYRLNAWERSYEEIISSPPNRGSKRR